MKEKLIGAAISVLISLFAVGAVIWRNDAVNQVRLDRISEQLQELKRIHELDLRLTRLEVQMQSMESDQEYYHGKRGNQ